MRYAAFNCNLGQSLGTTDTARQYDSWQDFAHQLLHLMQNQVLNTTLNLTQLGMVFRMIYAPYYYYEMPKCFLYEFRKS